MTEYRLDLLGVDPGKTTGFAFMVMPKADPIYLNDRQWIEVPGTPEEMQYVFGIWLKSSAGAAERYVVMEDWDSRRQGFTPDARMACEPIGMVKMLCHLHGIKVVMQRPQDRVAILDTEEYLEPRGWWIPGYKKGKKQGDTPRGDARQAERHCIAHAAFTLLHQPTLNHLRPRA